jgi:hypothetical protein
MSEGADLIRKRVPLEILASAIALIPCFWLPRIEAGDLGSHSYNAWLTRLLQTGQAPGLWVASQKNNILFDVLLLRLGSLMGFAAGERLAVCISVLVFLWGAYWFVSVVAGRPAWFLLPLLLMLTFGWTFHMGFFNFYLSLGLAFAALALFWRAHGIGYLYVVPFVPLIWMAHPLGLLCFISMASYVFIARHLVPRSHMLLAGAALACIIALHFFLARVYPVQWWGGRYADLLGTDQIVLGSRYQFLAWSLILAIAGCLALDYVRTRSRKGGSVIFFPLPLQLFILGLLALVLLPDSIWLPRYQEPISLITSRFTLATAVIGCCLLNSLRSRLLFGILSAAIAVAYFTLMYQDAVKTYALERQAEALVAKIPQGSRIITTIYPFRGFRIFVHHVMDRACIGRCFNIDNYEPSSNAFRLRATAGNRLVADSEADANHMMLGDYVVRPEDLPVWQVLQCGPREIDLCLRPLHPGPLRNISDSEIQRAEESHP